MVGLTIMFALGIGAIFAYTTDYGLSAVILAGIIGVPGALIGYFTGDKLALAINHARPLTLENNRELYNIVENVAITAGLPTPQLYIIPDESPNAFATGRDPRRASLALTRGLINLLDRPQLEGVVAHELAHIGDYDIRYMTIVAVLVGFVVIVSDFFLRFSFLGGRRRNRDNNGNLGVILLLVGLALAVVAPIFVQLMRLAISRKRESLADAKGAEITRQPEKLAEALIKIAQNPRPARFANSATAHLYFADISHLKGTKFAAKLLSSHPPVAQRVKKLYAMAGLKPDPDIMAQLQNL